LGLILASAVFAFEQANPPDLLKTADEMFQTVARIRGLEPKAQIEKQVKSRDEISSYLEKRIKEEYSNSEILQQEKMLKKLGFLPPDMNYLDAALKLYKEQIEGFYDPEKKLFVIAAWTPVDQQKPVMAHEFTHVLQDQYFNMDKLMKEDRAGDNDDRALAHQALTESDAIAVMLEYISHQDLGKMRDLASMDLTSMLNVAQSQSPETRDIPLYLKANLIFPYSYGIAFLQKAWLKDPSWQSINKLYSDMPISSEQIMHPDKYFAHDNPKPVQEEDIAAKLGDGWKATYKNVLGEFSLGLLLNLKFTDQRSQRSVLGWGGDEAMLLENGDKQAAYVNTIWDGADEAEIFFLAMQNWLKLAHPKARQLKNDSAAFSLTSAGEFYSVQRDGMTVKFILGLPEKDGIRYLKEQK
jgi:Zn-dependent peptidase ImmA (M78 family)